MLIKHVTIFNLSGAHGLDLAGVRAAFKKLHDNHLPCCQRFLGALFGCHWGKASLDQFHKRIMPFILRYNAGLMTTRDFLEEVYGQIDVTIRPTHEDWQYFENNRGDYLSIRGRDQLEENDIIFALIERAWRHFITIGGLDKQDWLQRLFDRANDGDPVFLVANTNPLDIFNLLRLWKEKHASKFGSLDPAAVVQQLVDHDPLAGFSYSSIVQIHPNIYLCPSFCVRALKAGKTMANLRQACPDEEVSRVSLLGLVHSYIRAVYPLRKIAGISSHDDDKSALRDLDCSLVCSPDEYNEKVMPARQPGI